MYRSIIWDLDGTLIDSYPAIARTYAAALAELGCQAPYAEIDALARVSLTLANQRLAERCGLQAVTVDEVFNRLYAETSLASQPPMPHVRTVLERVLALGGMNVIVTHRTRAGTLALLEAHDMTGYFTGILGGDDGYPRKPDPAAFLAALELYRLVLAETLAVGDRAIDIRGAQASGLAACLYGAGLEGVTLQVVVQDYRQLLAMLA